MFKNILHCYLTYEGLLKKIQLDQEKHNFFTKINFISWHSHSAAQFIWTEPFVPRYVKIEKKNSLQASSSTSRHFSISGKDRKKSTGSIGIVIRAISPRRCRDERVFPSWSSANDFSWFRRRNVLFFRFQVVDYNYFAGIPKKLSPSLFQPTPDRNYCIDCCFVFRE